jgi:26S proteasome non-ATPase regulatory subunit 10
MLLIIQDGWTGLICASSCGFTKTVSILLAAKADPNITTEGGETALHWASAKGKVEVVNLLVQHGAAVDIRNKVDTYLLHRQSTCTSEVGQKEY